VGNGPSSAEITGLYIKFQAKVLENLPRPEAFRSECLNILVNTDSTGLKTFLAQLAEVGVTTLNPWNVITDDIAKSTSQFLAEARALFPVSCYISNEQLDSLFPVPTASTTRVFLPNQEADEEQKNKSYQDLEAAGLLPSVITLRERIILEIQYFRETGKHLDVENITLTSSRDSRGRVVRVDWDGDELGIDWYRVGARFGPLRARVAVS
jgi:hypothetical protein